MGLILMRWPTEDDMQGVWLLWDSHVTLVEDVSRQAGMEGIIQSLQQRI